MSEPRVVLENFDPEHDRATYLWRILDNGELQFRYGNGDFWQRSSLTKGTEFFDQLKNLTPKRRYQFFLPEEKREIYFIEREKGRYIFHGFDPVICKECGSEIEVKVCPNCGEWN